MERTFPRVGVRINTSFPPVQPPLPRSHIFIHHPFLYPKHLRDYVYQADRSRCPPRRRCLRADDRYLDGSHPNLEFVALYRHLRIEYPGMYLVSQSLIFVLFKIYQ